MFPVLSELKKPRVYLCLFSFLMKSKEFCNVISFLQSIPKSILAHWVTKSYIRKKSWNFIPIFRLNFTCLQIVDLIWAWKENYTVLIMQNNFTCDWSNHMIEIYIYISQCWNMLIKNEEWKLLLECNWITKKKKLKTEFHNNFIWKGILSFLNNNCIMGLKMQNCTVLCMIFYISVIEKCVPTQWDRAAARQGM